MSPTGVKIYDVLYLNTLLPKINLNKYQTAVFAFCGFFYYSLKDLVFHGLLNPYVSKSLLVCVCVCVCVCDSDSVLFHSAKTSLCILFLYMTVMSTTNLQALLSFEICSFLGSPAIH